MAAPQRQTVSGGILRTAQLQLKKHAAITQINTKLVWDCH
jgi:hypothetical protein